MSTTSTFKDTRAVAAATRTIALVDVQEFRDKGELYDRRVALTLDCGHVRQLGIALVTPLPHEGDEAYCGRCHCGGPAA